MKYSIIIPYRNREEHLQILLPRLQELFKDESYEIIVSEQDNDDNFQIACVENVGYNHSKGEIIILHQVDYYPLDDVSYEVEDTPVLPARRGIFVDKDNKTERSYYDIPAGYRKWSTEIDPDFYGGVICMKREHYEQINGLNPLYKGWGNEDEDLRERFVWAGIPVKRNDQGTFLCLYHEDNGDMSKKDEEGRKDFFEGRDYFYQKAFHDRHIGHRNLLADVEEMETDIENVRWIKSKNYKVTG
jgi:glycosyltransferase involved in cell wall biosynthesis